MQWTIGKRISGALTLILALFIGTVMSYIFVYGNLRHDYDRIARGITASITSIKDLQVAFHEQNLNVRSFVLTGRSDDQEAIRRGRAAIHGLLTRLETTSITDGAMLQQLSTVRLMLAQYARTLDFIVLVRNEKGQAAAERYLEYGAYLARADQELQELVRLSTERADRFMADSQQSVRRLHIVFGCILLLSAVVAVMVAVRVRALIMRPLEQLVAGARTISQGDFDVAVSASRNDEFAEVGQAFNAMAASLKRAFSELAQGEHKYRELANLLPQIVYEVNTQGYFTYANQACYDMTGYTPEDVARGLHATEVISPEYHDKLRERFAALLSGRLQVGGEYLLRCKDGSTFPCIFYSAPVFEQGAVVGARGIVFNTTDLKQAEEALKESERKFRGIFEQSYQLMGLLAPDGTLLAANRTSLDFIGMQEKEVLGRPYWSTPWWAHSPREQQRLQAAVRQAAGGTFVRFETTLFSAEGMLASIDFSLKPVKNEQGRVVLIIPEGRDITDLRQAAEALQKSEEKYRNIFEQSNDGIFLFDAEGRITEWNQRIADITQLPQQEAIGKFIWDVEFRFFSAEAQTPQAFERLKSGIQRSLATGESPWKNRLVEVKIHLPDGTQRYIQDTVFPIKTSKGFIWGAISRDITELKRAQEEHVRLSTAIEQADEAIVIADRQGIMQYVNPAFTRITGYARGEAIGRTPALLKSGAQDEAFYRNLWRAITHGEIWKGHFVNRKKDGSLYDEEASISPIRDRSGEITNFVAVKRDITQERKIESRLHQAQKMEAIGALAGGIAHDFNNILGVIMGYTELTLEEVRDKANVLSNLQQVLLAADRARDLIRQILAISRQREAEARPIAVTPIVKETLKFMRASLPAMIEISQRLEADHDVILADPTQLHQVLMNLCANAGHAMKDRGGVLAVRMVTTQVDQVQAQEHPNLQPGQYLLLSVGDSGHGIPPEHLGRIFEPYFSTKDTGEGTGLGLAVVHGIVTGCGGDIRVYSERGRGTEFHVYLPLAKTEAPVRDEPFAELPRGTGRILFVDDEEALVRIATEMLERLGYRVTGMTSPAEAGAAFARSPGDFDLVITDKSMPKITGFDFARGIKQIRPDIPLLLCTGFFETVDSARIAEAGIDEVLAKPLDRRRLAKCVKRLLDRGKKSVPAARGSRRK